MHAQYLLRRSGQAVMTVVIVVTISFTMIRMLPGSALAYECIGGSTRACDLLREQGGSAGVATGELAIMVAFILLLVLVASYISTE